VAQLSANFWSAGILKIDRDQARLSVSRKAEGWTIETGLIEVQMLLPLGLTRVQFWTAFGVCAVYHFVYHRNRDLKIVDATRHFGQRESPPYSRALADADW
jgi:hypothetical protein